MYVDGSNVIIRASSFQGKSLICKVGDKAKCETTITNDRFTFTISEIRSDIEAVLGYAPLVTLTVSSDGNGKVWIGDDVNKTSGQFYSGHQVVIHAEPNNNNNNFRLFRWNDNNRETSRTITVREEDDTYSASFISADLIPGLFAVNSNGKQVFFSKGNLYYNGTTYCFENTQYDYVPASKTGEETSSHIGHFFWSSVAEAATSLDYYHEGASTTDDVFFANHPESFEVNGQKGWSVLTGNTGGEWEYLIDRRNTKYGKNRRYAAVKVNGRTGLLIFPDDISSWPSGAGNEPKTFNAISDNWNNTNYSVAEFNVLQENGCVFLPAAGCRNGVSARLPRMLCRVGADGYYWSASLRDAESAFCLTCRWSYVYPSDMPRSLAGSVRLVKEYK